MKLAVSCFILALIVYYPSLIDGSKNAAYLLVGDGLGWYLPAMRKVNELVSSFNFQGLDLFNYNGSSEYFLYPNLYSYYPPFLFYFLIGGVASDLLEIARVTVVILFINTFLSIYFAQRLFNQYFGLDSLVAFVSAAAYSLSVHMIFTAGQPNYIFCASAIPWAVYASLNYCSRSSISNLFIGSFPFVLMYTAGYIPLAAFCALLSIFMIISQLCVFQKNLTVSKVLTGLLPIGIASLIVLPYFSAIAEYNKDTISSTFANIYYSSYQLSESAKNLLRGLSSNYEFFNLKPFYEFTFSFGLIPLSVFALFVISEKATNSLKFAKLTWFKIFFVVYSLLIFVTLGSDSVFSDFLYYFLPKIGQMHIYQRFLLPANILFVALFGYAFACVLKAWPKRQIRLILSVAVLVLFVLLCIANFSPSLASTYSITNGLLLEVIYLVTFLFVLLIDNGLVVCLVAVVMMAAPTLNRMYDFSVGNNEYSKNSLRKSFIINPDKAMDLKKYIIANSDKSKYLHRYVDLTPIWDYSGNEPFPKLYSQLLSDETNLSSFTGYTFYLTGRKGYSDLLPYGPDSTLNPNWEYVDNVGAEFVVVDINNSAKLHDLKSKFELHIDRSFHLNDSFYIIPISSHDDIGSSVLYNNGLFRISDHVTSNGNSQVSLTNLSFYTDSVKYSSFNYCASGPTLLQYLPYPSRNLQFKINDKPVDYIFRNSIAQFDVPEGCNQIEATYLNKKLAIFIVLYMTYFFVLSILSICALIRMGKRFKR